jgi:acetyl-CoA/propionyl-CoA carboxylase biotin carboxyl carrier protein
VFDRVLVANRGEIAVRVMRTCRELGIETVAVCSDPDASAAHVRAADRAVHLPGVAATDTYLRVDAVIEAARSTDAQAVHPGYGFLSERADAARAVIDAGLAWVGPSPDAVQAVGDKLRARRLAESVGVPVVPGTFEPVRSASEIHEFGDLHGYPVAIKAAGGGGGRGFRVAETTDAVEAALEGAIREAVAYFGSDQVYLERYVPRPKHIEVQVLSERVGEAIWLGARECSLQRRHQKLVEETPPSRFRELVPSLGEAAARVADACGYTNAGTVEFLVGDDGSWYFLEVNARLQVEHTITEEVTGLDLVACQLRIASGEPLGLSQADVVDGGAFAPRGWSIECRINAEDPAMGFMPSPGVIRRYEQPAGPGVRVDGGFGVGDEISPAYDSLIAKLIVRAGDREAARKRMLRSLNEYVIEGVRTTIPALRVLLENEEFADGRYSTTTVEGGALDGLAGESEPGEGASEAGRAAGVPPEELVVSAGSRASSGRPAPEADGEAVLLIGSSAARLWNPAIASSISAAATMQSGAPGARASQPGRNAAGSSAEPGAIVAPMHGTILSVGVVVGDRIDAGTSVGILEAMKMETTLTAPLAGTVEEVRVEPGSVVQTGDVVAVVRPAQS